MSHLHNKIAKKNRLHTIFVSVENRIGNCDEGVHSEGDAPELGMDNVGGIFLVLGVGLLIGIILGVFEFIWNVQKVSIDLKVIIYLAHQ